MNGPHCFEAQACRGDFWLKLEAAVEQAGGAISIERMVDMTLGEVVELLAQNGLRMTYDKRWHIDQSSNTLHKD